MPVRSLHAGMLRIPMPSPPPPVVQGNPISPDELQAILQQWASGAAGPATEGAATGADAQARASAVAAAQQLLDAALISKQPGAGAGAGPGAPAAVGLAQGGAGTAQLLGAAMLGATVAGLAGGSAAARLAAGLSMAMQAASKGVGRAGGRTKAAGRKKEAAGASALDCWAGACLLPVPAPGPHPPLAASSPVLSSCLQMGIVVVFHAPCPHGCSVLR
jgi:hypothetical protein